MAVPGQPTTFLGHLEALRGVLFRCVCGITLLLVPGFLAAPRLLTLLVRYSCPPELTLNYFSPLEPFIVQMKLGFWLAFAAALPWTVYQLGNFIAPGLYRHERRIAGWGTAIAMVLFLAGMLFALFLIVPLLMHFSWSLATPELRPVIGIGEFVGMVTLLLIGFGLMFQVPVVLFLLVRSGVVEAAAIRAARPYVVVVIFILAAVLTPPDVVSQLLLALPTWLLFEAALFFAGRTARSAAPPTETGERRAGPGEAVREDAPDKVDDRIYRRAARKKRQIVAINGLQGGSRWKKRWKK